ncbi:RidA family protein [Limobrevibacterium gyesilva]|uniref:RidA family protein n=1 Tax=Limobrevibacterium gyesilva TaxID=2991712 RepID=A0AA42CDT4_9PROT|nr:RidA family protein [Limobrevibacterium gyesilva]MCW3474334.1 RidA family protein [Limobrevibacterium gyesilva]
MINQRLARLGLVLPQAAAPSFKYTPVTLHRGVAYVAGQLPKVDGEVRVFGKVGADVDLETARSQAQVCVLQGLACLRDAIGTLDQVEQVLRVNGYVASASGFNDQPKVLDAASELLLQIFEERGRHARSAVGVAELPRNAAVEIEFTFAYRE